MVLTRSGTDTVVGAKRVKYAEFVSVFSLSFHRLPLAALLKHSSVRDRFRWSAVSRVWCEHGSGGWRERLAVGDLVDARDQEGKWYDARLLAEKDDDSVRVHFRGWSGRWDCWLARRSPEIKPLHSHTPDWRRLQVGDIVELNSEADGSAALWSVNIWHARNAIGSNLMDAREHCASLFPMLIVAPVLRQASGRGDVRR
jgi:hypothetical protein